MVHCGLAWVQTTLYKAWCDKRCLYPSYTTMHHVRYPEYNFALLFSGDFIQFQNVPSLEGCTNVEHFSIDNKMYLAFSRTRAYRVYRAGTQIFRLEGNTFVLHQTLKSTYSGPEQAKYFSIDGQHYMAIPYLKPSKTVIFQWYKNYFQSYQELDCGFAALSSTFFEIKSSKYLAIYGYNVLYIYVWNGSDFIKVHTLRIRKASITECKAFQPRNDTYLTCAVWGGLEKSLVFKWTGTRFVLHQEIVGIEYAASAELIKLDNQTNALILAQRQHGTGPNMLNVNSPVYTWNTMKSIFELNTTLSFPTQGASACRAFKIGEDLYLIVAQSGAKESVIYRYRGGRFVVYQKIRAAFADDATVFTYQRMHYIALATKNMKSSPVFIWN